MRLSLRERRTRDLVQCSVAGNPGRDDKQERATFDKDWLLNRGALKPKLGQPRLNLAQDVVLGLEFLHFQGEAAPGSLAVLRF